MSMKTLKKDKIHPYVIQNLRICGGEPILNGTRISVRLIVELEGMGKSVDEIVAMYPHLSAPLGICK